MPKLQDLRSWQSVFMPKGGTVTDNSLPGFTSANFSHWARSLIHVCGARGFWIICNVIICQRNVACCEVEPGQEDCVSVWWVKSKQPCNRVEDSDCWIQTPMGNVSSFLKFLGAHLIVNSYFFNHLGAYFMSDKLCHLWHLYKFSWRNGNKLCFFLFVFLTGC